MTVCAIAETSLPGRLETFGRRAYRIYWQTSRHFKFFAVSIIFGVLGSLQTSLLCILGELSGGGSVAVAVAVAVGVSDR